MQKLLEQKRWLVVAGAVLIQFALGAIYGHPGAFSAALTDPHGAYAFTASETAWIFSVGIATFTAVMIGAGKVLPIIGPTRLTIMSAFVLGCGYILGGFLGDSAWAQILYIGAMGGAGIGFGYVVPIAIAQAWYPDKIGAASGFAVVGFGVGAVVWVKIPGTWLDLLQSLSIAGLPGVQSTYIVYGIAFIVLVLAGSVFMVKPRSDWQPTGIPLVNNAATALQGITTREMLRTTQFYGVWTVFFFSALAGLMVIYSMRLFGEDTLVWTGIDVGIASGLAGTAMAWYAIWNGAGRIIWGYVSDNIGRRWAIMLMVGFQGCTMLTIYHGFISFGHEWGLIAAASIIGFNFGGNFALMPAWTTDLFGKKHFGSNYPWVFTAYGVAGICGPLLAGTFKDLAGMGTEQVVALYQNSATWLHPTLDWFVMRSAGPVTWMVPFLVAGVLCLVAVAIPLFVQASQQNDILEGEGDVALERA